MNEGQTSLSLVGDSIAENAPGAVVGTVIVADPDAGDSQSFQVSDNRFEVVDGQLKLKDGVSLDHEAEPTVNVTVTATDSAGNQIQQIFAITVGDVNEAQTAMSLDNSSVAENAAGAVVGTLTVADPDAGDSQSFQVSDSRFEVVDGQLKLKDGVSLDHEGEPSVNVTVTATDSAGHQIQQTFTITVGDVNEAQTALTLGDNTVAENAAGAVIGALDGGRSGRRRQPELRGLRQPLRGGRRPAQAEGRRFARPRERADGQRHRDRHRQRRPPDPADLHHHRRRRERGADRHQPLRQHAWSRTSQAP